MDHLTLNCLLEEYQSPDRMLHRTETALLRVQHDTTLDQNHAVVLDILDFSAAFNTIDQQHQLHLLETNYGLTGTALSWAYAASAD